jgi:HlyD family secretion protein
MSVMWRAGVVAGLLTVTAAMGATEYYASTTGPGPTAHLKLAATPAQPSLLVRRLTFQARIAGGRQLAVLSELGGTITKNDIRYGMVIAAGQPLVVFDTSAIRARIAELTAEMAADREWLTNYYPAAAKAAGLSQESAARNAASSVTRARASVNALERAVSSNIASASDLADAKRTLEAAIKNSELVLSEGQTKTESLELLHLKYATGLQRAESALSGQRRLLEKTTVTAPFHGTVVAVNKMLIGTNNFDVAQGTYLLMLSDLESRSLTVNVNPDDLHYFATSRELDCTVTRLNLHLSCHVQSAQPEPDQARYEVTIALTAPPSELDIGEAASVTLVLATRAVDVAVPISALRVSEIGTSVALITPDGWRNQLVETGFWGDELVEITHGLRAGDAVVTDGTMQYPVGRRE